MITPIRLSYGVLALTIVLAGVLHLGTPLLVVLFSYFALRQLCYLTKRKWLALILFSIIVAGIAAAAVYFTRAAILALPDVADTSKRGPFCPEYHGRAGFYCHRNRRSGKSLFKNWSRPSPKRARREEQSLLHLLR